MLSTVSRYTELVSVKALIEGVANDSKNSRYFVPRWGPSGGPANFYGTPSHAARRSLPCQENALHYFTKYETFRITDDLLTPLDEIQELPEVAPPDWAIRMIAKQAGKRTPKYPLHTEVVYSGALANPHGPIHGPWGRPSCTKPPTEHRAYNPTRVYQSYETPSQSKIVAAGNLPEDDYRFWRGSVRNDITNAMCRWCGKWADNPLARRVHNKGRQGTQCTVKLRSLLDWARQNNKYCFACNNHTYKGRWGLPLCDRSSCIAQWKFGPLHENSGFMYALKKGHQLGVLDGYKLDDMMPVLRASLV